MRELTTRQVAVSLGLRPSTVQLYARNGRIPFDTTPGGHRRYDLSEVKAALASSAGTRTLRVAPVHPGWLVDATEFEAWADRRVAGEEFPRILRWLVTASVAELETCDFRAGEGIGSSGYDGRVRTARGNTWVPDGLSVWELGTGEDVTAKADADYAHRTTDALDADPRSTVFIFVTPRRWPRRDSWAAQRRAEGRWRDVRAFDADSLEQWLESAPAVHARVTRLFGRSPDAAADLATAWSVFASRTAPALTPAFLTAGREREVARLWEWLQSDGSPPLPVKGDSSQEALGFILSSLLELPEPEQRLARARTLIVRSSDAWLDALASSESPLILVPTFPLPQTAEAVDAGHHVAIPLNPDDVPVGEPMLLPRLRRESAAQVLAEAGMDELESRRLAGLARCSLLMFQRSCAAGATVARPSWAMSDHAADLVPAILAAAWRDESSADEAVLSALAGRPYDDIAASLARWRSDSDPPVRKTGNLWFLTDREDSWSLLSTSVTASHLRRFWEQALIVLTARDSGLDPEQGRRWTTGAIGKVPVWSQSLRKGMADTIAMMATRDGIRDYPGGSAAQEYVDEMVGAIFAAANARPDRDLWASLDPLLPSLAEASPRAFLRAVDPCFASGGPDETLGEERAVPRRAFPTHAGMLWALESLAWSPDYLTQTVMTLARLAETDPGGPWANRPAESLRGIFVAWAPQTSASLTERLRALDLIRVTSSDVAWGLMVRLMPSYHDASSPTRRPRWRDWTPRRHITVSPSEWTHQIDQVVDRLIEDVSPRRWAELIPRIDQLPVSAHDRVVSQLSALAANSMTADERRAIIAELRGLLHHHRRHADAPWAMPADRRDRLEAELKRLEEADPAAAAVWWFSHQANAGSSAATGFHADQSALEALRREAVASVLAQAGMAGIWRLAGASELPGEVGRVLADSRESDCEIIKELDGARPAGKALAAGYFARRFELQSWPWIDATLRDSHQWPSERTAALLACLPAEDRTFDLAALLGQDVEAAYWQAIVPFAGSSEARVRIVRGLAAHGRPLAAVAQLGALIEGAGSSRSTAPINTSEIVQILVSACPDGSSGNDTVIAYNAARVLDYLGSAADIEREDLAALEWSYLPLFEYGSRSPRLLHEELSRRPEFFADVVSWVYKSDFDTDELVTEESRTRAVLGNMLLGSWHIPPGSLADAAELADWVETARDILTRRGRLRVGDSCIGRVLAYSLEDETGFPPEQVRAVVEALSSHDLEQGLLTELYNSRGVIVRGLTQGGTRERALAARYRDYARNAVGSHRTRALLHRIADMWERDARMEDQRAEIHQDLEP